MQKMEARNMKMRTISWMLGCCLLIGLAGCTKAPAKVDGGASALSSDAAPLSSVSSRPPANTGAHDPEEAADMGFEEDVRTEAERTEEQWAEALTERNPLDLYNRSDPKAHTVKPEKKDGVYLLTPYEIGEFMNVNEDDPDTEWLDPNGKEYGFFNDFFGGCSEWCRYELYQKAIASSALPNKSGLTYSAENLLVDFDYDERDYAWCEGVPGDGIGEFVEISRVLIEPFYDYEEYIKETDNFLEISKPLPQGVQKPFQYDCLCIVNGYAKNNETWKNNNRVKTLALYVDGTYYGDIQLEDTIKPQYIPLPDVESALFKETKFKFVIKEVYKGSQFDDTCLTGIAFGFTGLPAGH